MAYHRYAVYYTPPAGPLRDLGAAWLGWDMHRGTDCAHPDWAADWPVTAITAGPRRYGFHATLKPPFRLAPGTDAAGLVAALRRLGAATPSAPAAGLEVARLGRFLALVAAGDPREIASLAGECVRALDAFRAPAPPDETARRRAAGLSPAQEATLVRWGYPYVMDEFRFHMTLSGRIDAALASGLQPVLARHFDAVAPAPFVIDAVTLAGEDATGRFHAVETVALSG